jgi:all-trans-8'-apo-beta-carotenal 15,15'-oxygenase
MVVTQMPNSPISPRIWGKAIAHNATEFSQQKLTVLQGELPTGLQGTLYRNGPGRLERGGVRMGHWFDGDGAILAVRFGAGGAWATYRYVQTTGFQAEEQADRLLYNNYGTYPPGGWWRRWRGWKNAANTSVLALPDRVLALWEGDWPHALDRETLATIGRDDLGGIPAGVPYSAHPKVDGQTGEIFNFGVSFGAKPQVQLYRSDRTGQIQQRSQVSLDRNPLLHDFVLAGRYLIFCVPPVRMDLTPILLRTKPICDAARWEPQLGTEIVVCDRDSLAVVCRMQTDGWYQWHFGNGAELTDGSVMFDLVRYEDLATNQFLKEVATGDAPTDARSSLWRIRLDPTTGKILENSPRLARQCEFPIVPPAEVGQPWQKTFLGLQREADYQPNEIVGTIGCLDEAGNLSVAPIPEGLYASEPIYAPNLSGGGWIVTVVYNGIEERSEVWVFEADRLADQPVCCLGLPGVIPPGFHGTWAAVRSAVKL